MSMSVDSLKLVSERQHLVDVLMSGKQYADIILKGGNVVNVITREIYPADVAVSGKYILMVGDCDALTGPDTTVYDMTGKYVMPGFVDCHMHFESAMLTMTEFSRLSIPTGTTCLISDPHEIGNVLGPVGIKEMAKEASLMPQHVFCRVPALTPDSPGLETAGYDVTSKDIPEMLSYPSVSGVGETQGVSAIRFVYEHNYPVIRDTIVSSVYARSIGKEVDGNAPELFGNELAAHIICGGTDVSCHETTTKKEAVEKLLNERDGLVLGICNGFQTLVKLGLVPYGEVVGQTPDSPTLTYNTIGRHISKMVYTKVVTNKSPWLAGTELGGVYTNPASHGEGRFVASKEWIDKLMANGQIATRYCDVNGNLTNDEYWNVNGSYCGIEGITSPDGRVFGKMAHAERRDNGVAVNIYGEQDLKIFESGVAYFK